MSLFDKFRKKKKSLQPVIMPVGTIAKIAPPMVLQNRLADFKDRGLIFRMHVKGMGSGAQGGDFARSFGHDEIDPPNVMALIGEAFGGGSYEIHFSTGDRVLMLESDPTKREVYHVRIAGPPKAWRLAQQTKAVSKAEVGNFSEFADMIAKVKQLFPEPETQNPMVMMTTMMDAMFGLYERMRGQFAPGLGSPVSPTGALTGGGWRTQAGEFTGSALAAYERGGGKALSQLTGGLVGGGQGQPAGALQQSAAGAMTAQPGGQARPGGGGFEVPGLGRIDPAEWIISQAEKRTDTDDLARNAVYILDVMSGVSGANSPASAYTRMWIDDPGGSFNRHIADRPQFKAIQQADPDYVSRLRASLFRIAQEYALEYVRQAAAQQPQPEAAQQTEEDHTDTWEGAEDASSQQTAEAQPEAQPDAEPGQSESGSQPGTADGHQGSDQAGQEC